MNSTGEYREQTLNENSEKYYCPMHCEGDKVYDEPGKCPICGMNLVSVSSEKSKHGHGHHTHGEHHMKMDKSNPGHGESYSCPMHCEGDKIYDKPGDCPVCGMHLVPS